jgi:drug/metabolite transporter (DMT)-like permease
MLSDKKVGTLLAFIVAVIWGLSFVAARVVLTTITPVLLATLRFVIASILFMPVIINERKQGFNLASRELVELAFLGFLSISIYFWLQYTGVQLAGAGISALLVVGLIPIVTGLISSLILRERFTIVKFVSTLLGFLGVSLITVPGLFVETIDYRFYIGVACLLGNTVCFALYSTMSRRLMQRIEKPALVTALITIFGTIALIPMSLTSDWKLVFVLLPVQWTSIMYLAIICSGCGYLLWNYALSKLEAMTAAVWLYLEPVVAFIGEALLFNMVPKPLTLLGGGVILISALLTSSAHD